MLMLQERAVRTILGLEPSPGGVFPSPGGLAQASLITDDEEEGMSIAAVAEGLVFCVVSM